MAVSKKKASVKPVAKVAEAKEAVKTAPVAEAPVTEEATAKKATEKKAAAPKKAAPAKETAVKAAVQLEYAGKSYTTEELVKIAQDVWQYDLLQKPADFKSVQLYVKPEENKVYYVINDEVKGSFNI